MDRNPINDRPESRTPEPRTLKVRDLMRDDPVVELDHDGQIYRLRITRNRKLILTK
jgi:hemin uptake protein HemP